MQVADLISLVTNVGFPVTLCFILIRYVLQTVGEKLDNLDASLKGLTQAIESIRNKEKVPEPEKKQGIQPLTVAESILMLRSVTLPWLLWIPIRRSRSIRATLFCSMKWRMAIGWILAPSDRLSCPR